MHGWMGKFLRVDLSKPEIKESDTKPYAEKFLGGRGMATRLYQELVGPETGAFDPENCLIYATGPVTGFTRVAGGCRWQ